MSLSSQAYVFDPRPSYPLLITVKRYWKSTSPFADDPNAITLIFTHGTGFHKEQWEPTIDDLSVLLESNQGAVKVREMWAIDCSNHGDAGVFNEKALQSEDYNPIFKWEEYGRVIHAFLAGCGSGVDIDFKSRKLVGIGHSMGAVCLMLALNHSPPLKFESLILCELITMHDRYMGPTSEMLVKGAVNRRDIWSSREEAYKLLKSRPAWRAWDDRVLKKFVEDGMRPLPTADYPNKMDGITLKCSRSQETACYRDPLGSPSAYPLLKKVVKLLPVHMIYGAIDDYISREAKDDVIANAGGERNFASLSRVEGAGHLIIQMNPRGLAQKIHDVLATPSNTRFQAKL